jgi:phage terminase small subunit
MTGGGGGSKIYNLCASHRPGGPFAVRAKSEGGIKNVKSGNNRPAPEPPGHLSDRSQALWRALVEHRCDSVERQVLLRLALEDLDRADALREQIEREGAIQTSDRSKLARAHAALKVEAETRRLLRTWALLDLTWRDRYYA